MASQKRSEQTARAGTAGGTTNRAERWVLVVGGVGLALLLGMVVGLTSGQGGPAGSVSETTASAAQVNATSAPYLLSWPNERGLGPEGGAVDFPTLDTAVGTANAAPYLLSPPNERDSGQNDYVAALPTYRLSPPNETDPGI
jgi:hypothetical protein